MKASWLTRRSLAAVCLAVLLLSSASVVGAVVIQGGIACAAMAAAPAEPTQAHGAHSCIPAPPARIAACSNAPCCVLAPDGTEAETSFVPAPVSSGVADGAPPPGRSSAAGAGPQVACAREHAKTSTGRERLALHSILLI
ncbi:MAG TPA: hypothetical protein VMT85_07915 [Thermoanaerobaculia bacterium]|nr:hypothetical protein [Thermoanaerobaculia bacterium]